MNIEIFGEDSPLSGYTKPDIILANSISGDSIYSPNIVTPTGSVGDIKTVLDNKADLSGATFSGQLKSPTISATTLTATTVYINNLKSLPTENVVIINELTDLPTISGDTYYLTSNTTYVFSQNTFYLNGKLNLSNNTNIYGVNKTNTILVYTGTGNFITWSNVNSTIRDIKLSCSGATLFSGNSSTSAFNLYLEQVTFDNCLSLGVINGGGVFAKYTLALNCGNGLILSGTLGSIIFDTASFRNLNGATGGTQLKISSGATCNSFRVFKSIFDVSAGYTSLEVYNGFTPSQNAVIDGNIFSGTGSRLVGVNGGNSGWTIQFGSNQGIAGYQQIIIDMVGAADSSITTNFPSFAALTQRATVLNVTDYDIYATTIKATSLVRAQTTNGSNFYCGLVDRDTTTLVTGSDGITVGNGGYIINKGTPIVITGNRTLSIAVARTSGQATTVRSSQILLEIY